MNVGCVLHNVSMATSFVLERLSHAIPNLFLNILSNFVKNYYCKFLVLKVIGSQAEKIHTTILLLLEDRKVPSLPPG